MIATFLVQYPWVTTAALLAVVVVGPFVGVWVASRPSLAWVLTGIVLLAVFAIALYPESRRPAPGCQVSWSFPTLGAVELIANIILFVPPVLLAAIASRRPFVAFVAGSALSVLIELLQLTAPGIGRSCDTGDWLQNTIGAGIGAALAVLSLFVVRRRESRRAVR